MPLHDWATQTGWEGVHIYWMTEIARWLKGHLPQGYRAFIGASPLVAIDVAAVKPDVSVRRTSGESVPVSGNGNAQTNSEVHQAAEPDFEVAIATLQEDTSVLLELAGRLVAAVELVSPRNKDRPSSRAHYGTRYVNYLKNGVHLLLVDVHPRPANFSFSAMIAAALDSVLPSGNVPEAVSYRVGEPAAEGGRMLGVWRRPLVAAQEIPALTLALAATDTIVVDLESTYKRAAADAYLE